MKFFLNACIYALISILILVLPVLVNDWLILPDAITQGLSRAPYFIFMAGLILCWLFYNSREFNLLLIMAVSLGTLQYYFWGNTLTAIQKHILFDLYCLLLPLNFVVFNFLKERGILNHYGIRRIVFVLIQVLIVGWLVYSSNTSVSQLVAVKFLENYTSVIKQPLLVIMMTCMLVLVTDWVIRGNQLRYAWIMILSCNILAFHHINTPHLVNAYFLLAGIITIVAIVIHSYNLAYKDELTQLPSRRALKQKLASLGKQYAIAMADVDHFKKLNDTYGHDVGDDVLKLLATHLSEVEGGGKAYRYGGEEFTIVFPGKDAKSAAVYLEALRVRIESNPFIIRHKKRPRKKPEQDQVKPVQSTKALNLTVSIGVADSNTSIATPQDVIKLADKALYKAKNDGRNRVMTH